MYDYNYSPSISRFTTDTSLGIGCSSEFLEDFFGRNTTKTTIIHNKNYKINARNMLFSMFQMRVIKPPVHRASRSDVRYSSTNLPSSCNNENKYKKMDDNVDKVPVKLMILTCSM